MYSSFCMEICHWENYFQSMCNFCPQSIKNNDAPTIQSVVCKRFNAKKGDFAYICDHGWNLHPPLQSVFKSVVSWVDSSRWQPKTQISAGKVLATVFWDAQGISFIDYLEADRTINSEYHIALFVHLKEEIAKKTATNEEEKSAPSPRQYTTSQVYRNDGKTTWVALQIASARTFSSRSGPKRQLAVSKLQKNAPDKEFWHQ